MKDALTYEDIKVGCTYRGKRAVRLLFGGYDDRTVLHIGYKTFKTKLTKPYVTCEVHGSPDSNYVMTTTCPCIFCPDREVHTHKIETTLAVQYDSPTLRLGLHYPRIPIDRFIRWAKEQVE